MKLPIRRPTIGLALGGGGARGLAHIGILKVLVKEGIPIDYICGTSMGGVIACAFAAGKSADALEEIALEFSRVRNLVRMLNVTSRRRGLITGKRVQEIMERMNSKTKNFSDLKIPCAVTGVDLISGQSLVFSTGSVLEAVMMTTAFPGVFEPVVHGDRLVVDGGILNNLPADIARMLGAEMVIAVDVSPRLSGTITGGNLHIDPLSPGYFPAFLSDFYRAELIMMDGLVNARLRDARPEVLIHPPMPYDLSIFLGFPRAMEAIAAGETAATKAIPKIRQALIPTLGLAWRRINKKYPKQINFTIN
jgi:NTE family protein